MRARTPWSRLLRSRTRASSTRRAVQVALAAALTLASVDAATATGAAANPAQPKYLDRSAPIAARVNDLIGRMTLPEKAGQMDQQLVDNATAASGGACGAAGFNLPTPACMQSAIIDQNVGSVLAGGTDNPADTTGGRHQRQHRSGLGRRLQHHPAVRDLPLAAAHPAVLRRRRRPRLRPPLAGAAVPAVHRHGRDLGPLAGPGRRRDDRRGACARPAGRGPSRRCRTWRATTAGAGPTRPGPRSPRCPPRWAPQTLPACRRRHRPAA